eukprot:2293429-Pyramimonas_sp.AAC.1
MFDVLGNPLDMCAEAIANLSTDQVLRWASDGSCSKPPIRPPQRAAWARGALPGRDGAPEPVFVMRGVVHGTFLHAPAMPEHVAIAFCGQVASRPSVHRADGTAAIKITQRSVSQQLAATS